MRIVDASDVALLIREFQDGVVVVDDKGCIVDFNPAFVELLGYAPVRLLGMTCSELTPLEFAPLDEMAWRQALETGSFDAFEKEYVRADGTLVPVSLSGGIIGGPPAGSQWRGYAFVRDISEQKRLEADLRGARDMLAERVEERTAELRASQSGERHEVREREEAELALHERDRMYRDLFEQSKDAIGITTREGEFVDANEATGELGYSRRELLSMSVIDLYADPSDRLRYQEQIERDGHVSDYPVRLRTKAGEVRECQLSSTVRRGRDGSILGYLTVVRDVTEQNQMHKQLELYRHDLRSLGVELIASEDRQRRRLSSELHDGVAQNLALAQLRLQMMRERQGEEAERLRQELSDLIAQMETDVRSLMFELSPPILYEIGLGAAVEWLGERLVERGGPCVSVEGDELPDTVSQDIKAVLFRSVRELLANVEKHAEAHNARVLLGCTEDEIRVEVEDDGKGFDPNEVMSIREHGGFGLFSIRDRMDFLGGSCQISSALGKGARCVLTLPRREDESEESDP